MVTRVGKVLGETFRQDSQCHHDLSLPVMAVLLLVVNGVSRLVMAWWDVTGERSRCL